MDKIITLVKKNVNIIEVLGLASLLKLTYDEKDGVYNGKCQNIDFFIYLDDGFGSWVIEAHTDNEDIEYLHDNISEWPELLDLV